MKIYIAGSFAAQERLRGVAKRIESQGHEVTSKWLYEPDGLDNREYALTDLRDIDRANFVIFDLLDPSTTGGRDVEFGYVLAKGLHNLIVGKPYGIFYSLADDQFDNWEEVYPELGGNEWAI